MALGTSLHASVSACTNERLLSKVPPLSGLPVRKLPDVGDQLVDQHHAGRMSFQQSREHLFAGRRAGGVGLLDERETLPRRRAARPARPTACGRVCLPCCHGWPGAWAWPSSTATLRLRHVHQPGLVDQRRDAGQVAERALPRGQVIDRQHGVRLAAAKGRLELDDRLAALAVRAAAPPGSAAGACPR